MSRLENNAFFFIMQDVKIQYSNCIFATCIALEKSTKVAEKR